MPERKVFSTNDLVITKVTGQDRFPGLHDNEEFYHERVWFSENNWADVRMNLENGSLKWVDNRVICLDNGIGFYYDHKYWAPPFGMGFQPRELNGSYPAVIDFTSVSEVPDGRISSKVTYGNFWYDPEGRVKAISCGHLTHSEFEFNVPFVNLYMLDQDNWLIYRMKDIFEATYTHLIEGKEKAPEDQLLHNGQEIITDEIATSVTDDGEIVKLHQRTLLGHRQKTITVPSRIDLVRWADDLARIDGEWTKAFSDFPSRIELVV